VDVASYLRRIEYSGSRAPTLDTLRALHYAHLLAVPFENLDISRGVPIVLDEARLFDKIIVRRRGGFCYELNGLFAALLCELGFNVTLLSARVPVAENVTGPEFDHMTLRVDLKQPWLADVGFGECFLYPIPLDMASTELQRDTYYRVDEHDGHRRLLRSAPHGEPRGVPAPDLSSEWRMLYDFTLIPRQMSEFGDMCRYHQTSPDSHFTRRRICSRLTSTGRITLTEMRLVATEGTQRYEYAIPDDAQYASVLRDYFGVELSGQQQVAGSK
jgi:N-hydroxyarylamine O-acetyltransferase